MRIITTILLLSSIGLHAQVDIEFVDSLYKPTKVWRMKRDSMIPAMLVNEKLDWSDWEIKLSSKEKDEYLKRLVGNKFFPTPYYIVREDYHLIDFNGDDSIDVIYAGREPAGGEIDNFAFFENRGDSLYLSLKLLGTIIEINRKSSTAPINFVVWEWPCCAQQIHRIYYYSYYNRSDITYNKNNNEGYYTVSYGKYIENNVPNFNYNNTLTYVKSTLLPEVISFDENVEFSVVSDSAKLETNPKKTFETERMMEYIREDYQSNIVIAQLPKGQKGVVLNKMIYRGNTFYFIKTSCEKAISELVIGGTNVINLIGWITEKDVAIIKPLD